MQLTMLTKFFIILFGGLGLAFVLYTMISVVSAQSEQISHGVAGYKQPVFPQTAQLPTGEQAKTSEKATQDFTKNICEIKRCAAGSFF